MGCVLMAVNVSQFQSTHPSGVRPRRADTPPPDEPISIHAPQWGATYKRESIGCSGGFQSTHPSGVRRFLPVWGLDVDVISIHAPQWGATCGLFLALIQDRNFNPRTPVGCDLKRFNASSISKYFNPRTPVGCDLPPNGHGVHRLISIHAPQWGATRAPPTRSALSAHFNPRTPVGCD